MLSAPDGVTAFTRDVSADSDTKRVHQTSSSSSAFVTTRPRCLTR